MADKMTIHRALSELKVIDKKIQKRIENLYPTGVVRSDDLVNGVIKKETFEKDVKSQFDSVNDLIRRKLAIKSAIVTANAETTVKIGSDEMTISDAINYKTIVATKQTLIESLKGKHKAIVAKLNTANEQVDANALNLAQTALSKDNVKITDTDAIAVTKPYIDANKFTLVDPLGIEEEVSDMEDSVLEFESEVDAVLSEINATTFINI